MSKKLTRRQFLTVTGLSTAGAVLAACTPAPAPTAEVIKETVEVMVKETEVIKETVEVKVEEIVEVTATEVTGPTNSLGITLPADALPLDQQIWQNALGYTGGGYGHIMESLYNRTFEHNGGYEALTTMNIDYEVIGQGCESFEMAPDGSYWDFKLREGLMWSDGNPVTAKDWVFTMQRSLNNSYDFAWFYFDIKNASKVTTKELPPDQLGMEAVDDYTLRIYTEKPTPYLPGIGTWFGVAPPQAYGNSLGETNNWALNPATYISCGPYILTKFERGVIHEWSMNTKYTGARINYFEKIIDRPMAISLPAYIAGDIKTYSVSSNTPPAEVQLINSNPALRAETHPQPGTATWYIGFNNLKDEVETVDKKMVKNPFRDQRVRYAFAKAIDKETLTAELLRGFGNVAWGILPPGFPNYNPDLKDLDINKYDPEAAKALLAEAGYPNGEGFPVFDMWVRVGGGDMDKFSQAMQARWKENLGVQVEIRNADFQSYTAAAHKDKVAAIYFVAYSMDYFDPATFLNVFVAHSIGGREINDDVAWTEFYQKANGNLNLEERLVQLKEAEKMLVEAGNQFFLYVPFSFAMIHCNIAGFTTVPNKDGYRFFAGGAPGCIHAWEGMYWSNSKCRENLKA